MSWMRGIFLCGILCGIAASLFSQEKGGGKKEAVSRAELRSLVEVLSTSKSQLDFRDGPAAFAKLNQVEEAKRKLRVALRTAPKRWKHVRKPLVRILGETAHRDVKSRVLTILAQDPSSATQRRMAQLLKTEPTIFSDDALLFLDARGVPGARKRMTVVLAGGARTPSARVALAVQLALDRDKAGVRVLRAIAADDRLRTGRRAAYAAAVIGLHALGEKRPWRGYCDEVGREAAAALEEGNLRKAASLLGHLEFFASLLARGSDALLAEMDRRHLDYLQDRKASTRTDAEIRRELEKFRKLTDA